MSDKKLTRGGLLILPTPLHVFLFHGGFFAFDDMRIDIRL